MIFEILFTLPSMSIMIGAICLMLLSHNKNITLNNFNHISLFFLTIALIFEIIILETNINGYLFIDILDTTSNLMLLLLFLTLCLLLELSLPSL